MSESNKPRRKRGRPTPAEQTYIQNIIRPYFEAFMTETTTAKLTGININTISKYFKHWKEQLIEENEQDLAKKQKAGIQRGLIVFDSVFLDVQNHRAQIQRALEQIGKIPFEEVIKNPNMIKLRFFLEQKRRKLNDQMARMIDLRVRIETTPTVGDAMNLRLKEMEADPYGFFNLGS